MEEEIPFIEKSLQRRRKAPDIERITLWILVVLFSLYTALTWSSSYSPSAVEKSWTLSDFASARSAIHRTKATFTSSLEFTDSEHVYRVADPLGRVYVGDATPEIDQAWTDLIQPAEIYITDQEAATVSLREGHELYRSNETGQFRVELEVFHSLHCLNMIRKRIYSDSYPEMLTQNARTHVDHCIEAVRELIMCGGDMTPIPVEWSHKGQRANPNFAGRHSCRDFDALKAWAKTRHFVAW